MHAAGRTRSLLQLLPLLIACAAASDDLWSACDTGNYLYDYRILDKGCKLHCLYLTSSYKELAPEDRFLDTLLESQHSLEGRATCSATGYLCVSVVSAKFFEYLIPGRYPSVKFVISVGSSSFSSDDQPRHPVFPDGRVQYNAHHCFRDVDSHTLIHLYAMGTGLSVVGGKVALLTESDGLTARKVLREGKNGTLFSVGDITDTIIDLKITFTR